METPCLLDLPLAPAFTALSLSSLSISSISLIPVFFFFFFIYFLDPIKSHTQICPGTMGSLLFSLIGVGLRTQCIFLFLSSRKPANQRLKHENPNPAARVPSLVSLLDSMAESLSQAPLARRRGLSQNRPDLDMGLTKYKRRL